LTEPRADLTTGPDLDELQSWVRASRLRAGFFAVFFAAAAMQTYSRPFLVDGGFSHIQAAGILAIVYATLGIFRLVAVERILRRFGGKTAALGVLGYAQFAAVVGLVGYAVVSKRLSPGAGYGILVGSAVLFGLGGSLLWGGSIQITLDDSARSRYGRSTQYLYVATQTGVLLGLVAMDWLLSRTIGARIVFPVWVAAALAGAVLIYNAGKDVAPPVALQATKGLKELRVLWLPVVMALSGFGLGIMYSMLNVYAKDLKGLEWMGRITMPFFVMAMLTNFWAGRLSDSIGRGRTIAAGFAAGALGMMIPVAVRSAAAGAVAAGLLGVMSALVVTSAVAWVGDMTAKGARTRLYGKVFCGSDFGAVIAIVTGGVLAQGGIELRWGFLALGVLFGVSALASLALPRGKEKQTPEAAA